jgi:RNA polymerase sigma-70 factor (ECF subfamily)
VLAADVTLWADGGPKARAARRPIVGSDAVARWLVGVVAKAPVESRVEFAAINGRVAAVQWVGEALTSVTTIDVLDDRIRAIRAIINPDKLAYLARRLAPPPAAAI